MVQTTPAVLAASYTQYEQFLFCVKVVGLLLVIVIVWLATLPLIRYIINRRRAWIEEKERLATRQKAIVAWEHATQLSICVTGDQYDALIARLEAVLSRLGDSRHLGEELTGYSRRMLKAVCSAWQKTTKRSNQYDPNDVNRSQTRYEEIIDHLMWMQEQLDNAEQAYNKLVEFCERSEKRLATQQGRLDALRTDIAALSVQVEVLSADGFDTAALRRQLADHKNSVATTANCIAEGDIFRAEKELERTTSSLAAAAETACSMRSRQTKLEAALPGLETVVADLFAKTATALEKYGQDVPSQVQDLLETLKEAHDHLEDQLLIYEMHLAHKEAEDAEATRVIIEELASTIKRVHKELETAVS
jgi:archaellum component FlaC